MANNADAIKVIIQRQLQEKYDEIEQKLRSMCRHFIEKAVAFRLSNPNAHNFTGNLLNSIVAGIWRNGKYLGAYTPNVKTELYGKMTAPGSYYFTVDYEGVASRYKPAVMTDRGYGDYDAREFIMNYQPDPKALFEIVIAYTVEYASFVEMQNHTVGFLELEQYVKTYGIGRRLQS